MWSTPLIPALWEAEATGSVRVRGQLGLHDELQDSQGYILRPCLNRKERAEEGKKGKKERKAKQSGGEGELQNQRNSQQRALTEAQVFLAAPSPSLLRSHSEVRESLR